MPRRPAIQQDVFPYHVAARCINKEWFFLPMDDVWMIMCLHLHYTVRAYNLSLHSFVLMQNHFHMLVSTPEANLSSAMHHFMTWTSRDLTKAANRINQTYGGRYFRSIIPSHHYYLHAYKYIYRNPVAVGLCKRVEEYPYSSLSGLLGFSKLEVPLVDDVTLFEDIDGTLKWLNTSPQPEASQLVGAALKRTTFALAKDRSLNKPSPLESQLF